MIDFLLNEQTIITFIVFIVSVVLICERVEEKYDIEIMDVIKNVFKKSPNKHKGEYFTHNHHV